MNSTTQSINAVVKFCCAERCVYTLNFPVALRMKLPSLKKLITYMFSPEHRETNIEAIRVTERVISDSVDTSKAEWERAQINFLNGFRSVQFLPDADKYKTELSNKTLEKALRSAASEYNRYCKIKTYFDEAKAKYGGDGL